MQCRSQNGAVYEIVHHPPQSKGGGQERGVMNWNSLNPLVMDQRSDPSRRFFSCKTLSRYEFTRLGSELEDTDTAYRNLVTRLQNVEEGAMREPFNRHADHREEIGRVKSDPQDFILSDNSLLEA